MTINKTIKPMPAINCTQPSPEGFNFLVLIYTSFYKKLVILYHGFYRVVITIMSLAPKNYINLIA
ncbi:hypothetical protein PAGU1579_07210 [Veillonella tobetsuensis]|uniref:Uncharacterized protein n=1 Tax=Veillonella tobetsuensis TaxID=1110546 RepID=A0A480B870_9FIRM|nr:hypothetical protein PAGU1579_07210 [Veillonella tobetsuensis]